tara:strand:+ start:492 stop:893 length:402 start_codon:yes stop_codon:yes gene_type:complete
MNYGYYWKRPTQHQHKKTMTTKRPTHHNGFRILYADNQTAQHLGNGERCEHHEQCGAMATLENNNGIYLCQDHAEEYRPCDCCGVHVRAGEQLGRGWDWLCENCFDPQAAKEEDGPSAMLMHDFLNAPLKGGE